MSISVADLANDWALRIQGWLGMKATRDRSPGRMYAS